MTSGNEMKENKKSGFNQAYLLSKKLSCNKLDGWSQVRLNK